MGEDSRAPRPIGSRSGSKSDAVLRQFMSFETHHGVFDETVQGYPYWQTVRLLVARNLQQGLGIQDPAHDASPEARRGKFHRTGRIIDMLRRFAQDNPLRAGHKDVVVLGHPRRKLEEDGTWWDLYCDPWIDSLQPSWVYLERRHAGGSRRPAKTPHLFTLSLFEATADLKKRFNPDPQVRLTHEEGQRLRELDENLTDTFGVAAGLRTLVLRRLERRRLYLPLYRRLLSRIRPRIALIVVGYFNHDFVEACKKTEIPVAELQHGYIGPDHLGYSFPPQVHTKVQPLFPDHLLVFGDYWKDRADFPIPSERVRTVGYPYFDLKRDQYQKEDKKAQIIFLSQGILGRSLSQIAVQLAQREDLKDLKVVYKLHPGEYRRWRSEYPWLLDSPVEVVDQDRPHLYQLLAESTMQVGSFSTAVFEGLGFSLATFLYRPSSPGGTQDLIDLGVASYFDTSEDLAELVKGAERNKVALEVDPDLFFAQKSTGRLVEVIDELVDTRTARSPLGGEGS